RNTLSPAASLPDNARCSNVAVDRGPIRSFSGEEGSFGELERTMYHSGVIGVVSLLVASGRDATLVGPRDAPRLRTLRLARHQFHGIRTPTPSRFGRTETRNPTVPSGTFLVPVRSAARHSLQYLSHRPPRLTRYSALACWIGSSSGSPSYD